MKETRIEDLNLSVFAPLVNTAFRVRQDGAEPVPLVLTEARPFSGSGASSTGQGQSFSLIFRGPERCFLPQQLYDFEHEKLGRFSLFIVPVGRGNGAFEYQAVFNRLG